MQDRLTIKERKFVYEYVNDGNGTEAARRAGYAGSDNVLASTASQLLRKPKILRALEELLAQSAMPANEVLMHLSDIARADIADAVGLFGAPDIGQASARGKSQMVKRIRTKTTTLEDKEIHETELEMYDRLKALELLAKYHDLVNRVKVDDWRTDIIALLRDGKITREQVEAELGKSLATELFDSIGLSTVVAGES